MIPVLTVAESAKVDAASPESPVVLMRRAGAAAAHLAVTEFGVRYGSKVVVLAGPGNNGGDGYVVATSLARRGASVAIVAFGSPRSEAARHHATRAAHVSRIPFEDPDLIVDAVFGAGSRPGLPDDVARWAQVDAPVMALDVPSGLDADTGDTGDHVLAADMTVAFHTLKPGHLIGDGPDVCGRIEVVDIGLEGGHPAYRLVEAGDAPRPPRDRRAHKWSAGSVLVIGGTEGMVGAAAMAGRAALRFGAGAVGVATPHPQLLQGVAPELLAHHIDELPGRYQVWLVGPGLGSGFADLVTHAYRRPGPTVVDADALRSGVPDHCHEDIVLTPHQGELDRLGRVPSGPTVLRKGNPTIVQGDVPWIVASGGPELASIGTGDVLAGMIAALLARGAGGPEAARSAAYWHGVAGAELLGREGHVTADRLAAEVGRFAWDGG